MVVDLDCMKILPNSHKYSYQVGDTLWDQPPPVHLQRVSEEARWLNTLWQYTLYISKYDFKKWYLIDTKVLTVIKSCSIIIIYNKKTGDIQTRSSDSESKEICILLATNYKLLESWQSLFKRALEYWIETGNDL